MKTVTFRDAYIIIQKGNLQLRRKALAQAEKQHGTEYANALKERVKEIWERKHQRPATEIDYKNADIQGNLRSLIED